MVVMEIWMKFIKSQNYNWKIEDAAHAFGSLNKNKLIDFGDIACFSFDG